MDFNHYFSNDEVESVLESWVQEYPHLASVNELGKSHEKRTIPVLTLTNRKTGSDEDKPAIWIDSNIQSPASFATLMSRS